MRNRIALVIALCFLAIVLTGCLVEKVDENGVPITASPVPVIDVSATPEAELLKEDIKMGEGEETKAGDKVKMHYVGTLTDGTKFDSSRDRNQPFEFTIGNNEVIQGWEQGIPGMKVGGVRKLTIPPNLGYGEKATGSIPAKSTLIFEVELLEIVK